MRGTLLGLLFVSIPLTTVAAELPDIQAGQAIALIHSARRNRTEGYIYRAEADYRHALAILEQTSGERSPDLIPALNGLAELYFDARRYTEAESLSRRSAELVEAALGDQHPLLATALQDLAAIYHVQGQYAKAEPLYYRALAIREKALGPNHPFVAVTLADLAEMESAQGNRERAVQHYARAVRIQEEAFGMYDPRVAETLAAYAAVLRKSCRHKHEAESAEAQSRAILAQAAFR
jgi:tetratricopeptide (TPR) repeat protein